MSAPLGRAEFLDTPTSAALRAAGRLEVGAHTYGAVDVRWWGEDASLRIGRFCSIAQGVTVVLGGNHRTDWVSTYPFTEFADWPGAHGVVGHPATKGDVVIGSDVWVGDDAWIMSGVTIGHGAVVGARSLVTKDVAPYTIVGGNPAGVIRRRFAPDVVARLLELAWWDLPDDDVRRLLPALVSPQVEAVLGAAPDAGTRRRPWRRRG